MMKKGDLERILRRVNEIEGITIEGDLEVDLGPTNIGPLIEQLSKYIAPPKPKVEELLHAKFEVEREPTFTTGIEEVTIGATSADGGTRKDTVTLGGQTSLNYYNYEGEMPNPVAVSVDCFDMPIPLARAVREKYADVMESPGDWAKRNVEYGADMVTIHLVSTDPAIKDTPAKEAVKTVEEVLEAVKVPIVIGGSGNPNKDPEVLEKAAEVAEGERCLIASANLGMDYERIGKAANKYGHVTLAWTQLSISDQKTLNRHLFKLGTRRDSIVQDPTTAALGYGIDFAFSNIQRMRLGGLKGDTEVNFPISGGVTNAWGAREAWMKKSPIPGDSDWGDRMHRGPIYEIITGYVLSMAGMDMMMMMHPEAAAYVRHGTNMLRGDKKEQAKEGEVSIDDWISVIK